MLVESNREEKLELNSMQTEFSNALTAFERKERVKVTELRQEGDNFFFNAHIIMQNNISIAPRKIIIGAFRYNTLRLYEIIDKKIVDISTHKLVFPIKVAKGSLA